MNRSDIEKAVVVTGSTSGIGEGIARRFAADGFAVAVSGRNIERGQRVAREIGEDGGRAHFVRADITSEPDCTALIQSAVDQFGRLDVLVNNAAIFPAESFDESPLEMWDGVFAVNVRGAFLCCRAAIPAMRRRVGWSIIKI